MTALWEILGKLFFAGLDFYLRKKAHDEQSRKDYLAFLEIMDRKGLVSVEMRMKATEQIDRLAARWEERIKQEQENNK